MAKAIFVQKGNNIDYTPNSAVEYMEIIPLEDCVGVALEAIAANETGTVTLTGVFEFPAATGTAVKVGEKVYWDSTNSVITTTASGNTLAGYAISAKASADATVKVRIG